MKKILLISIFSLSLMMSGELNTQVMASTITPQSNNSTEAGTFVVINPGDGFTWKWYYTDYSLNDGWYEKWYKYEDGAGIHYMVKTYNSKRSLIKTRYI